MAGGVERGGVDGHAERRTHHFFARRVRRWLPRRRERERRRRQNIDPRERLIVALAQEPRQVVSPAIIAATVSAQHILADQHAELDRVCQAVTLRAPHRLALHCGWQINAAWSETEAIAVKHGSETSLGGARHPDRPAVTMERHTDLFYFRAELSEASHGVAHRGVGARIRLRQTERLV